MKPIKKYAPILLCSKMVSPALMSEFINFEHRISEVHRTLFFRTLTNFEHRISEVDLTLFLRTRTPQCTE